MTTVDPMRTIVPLPFPPTWVPCEMPYPTPPDLKGQFAAAKGRDLMGSSFQIYARVEDIHDSAWSRYTDQRIWSDVYVLYAASYGRTPEEQLSFDRVRWGGNGHAIGFEQWERDVRMSWEAERGDSTDAYYLRWVEVQIRRGRQFGPDRVPWQVGDRAKRFSRKVWAIVRKVDEGGWASFVEDGECTIPPPGRSAWTRFEDGPGFGYPKEPGEAKDDPEGPGVSIEEARFNDTIARLERQPEQFWAPFYDARLRSLVEEVP